MPDLPTTAHVRASELAAALRAVRFAAGADPDLPALGAVLFDVGTAAITLVATDRFRMAVAPAACAEVTGPPVGALVPTGLVDRITEHVAGMGDAEVVVAVRGATIGVGPVEGALLPDAYPDYRSLLSEDGRPVPVDDEVRAALAAAPTRTMTREPDGVDFEVAALGLTSDGALTADGSGGIGVNREFLLQAIDAGGPGQLELLLDGPLTPLVVRSPRSVSLLMPVRL